MPGSMAIFSNLTPALTAKSTLSSRWLNISDIRSSYSTSICIVAGVPLMCMSITPALFFAHTPAIAGSNVNALISFIMAAPSCRACLATSDFVVSTDMAAPLPQNPSLPSCPEYYLILVSILNGILYLISNLFQAKWLHVQFLNYILYLFSGPGYDGIRCSHTTGYNTR